MEDKPISLRLGIRRMEGLAPAAWHTAVETTEGSKLMLPILIHMFDDHGNSLFGLAQEEIDEALAAAGDAIPEVVPAIYAMLRA